MLYAHDEILMRYLTTHIFAFAFYHAYYWHLFAAIHDAYCETDNYRIVLEYMNGGDLLTMLQEEKSLTEMKTRNICHSLMSAVAHLHAHSIAHR